MAEPKRKNWRQSCSAALEAKDPDELGEIVQELNKVLTHEELTMARMQVVAEMNHHIRNTLSPISLWLDATDNQPLNRVISEAVDRIDWALREILPRAVPLREGQSHDLGYFQTRRSS